MRERTLGTIALSPRGNIQGSYKFMNLRTGKLIVRREFDELPAPDAVVNRVHKLVAAKKCSNSLTFYNRNQVLIGDDDDFNTPDAKITGVDDDGNDDFGAGPMD
eukprot:1516639-Ditylum_brightwellii.AAC.1